MSTGVKIGLAVGGVVVVGGGLALALAGDSTKPDRFPGRPGGLSVGGLGGGGLGNTGLHVGLACKVTIDDLDLAKAAAFKAGRAGPNLMAARRALFQFGECGVSDPLNPGKQALELFVVEFELWRGAAAAGYLTRWNADILIQAARGRLIAAGFDVTNLPTRLPS